jgi:hypothetical protein
MPTHVYIFVYVAKKNGIDRRKISRRDCLLSIIIYLFNKIYNTYPATIIWRRLKPLNIITDPRTIFNWWWEKKTIMPKKTYF